MGYGGIDEETPDYIGRKGSPVEPVRDGLADLPPGTSRPIPDEPDPDALIFPWSATSLTYREARASEAYRGCPFGMHAPGEPHHYTCRGWFD